MSKQKVLKQNSWRAKYHILFIKFLALKHEHQNIERQLNLVRDHLKKWKP